MPVIHKNILLELTEDKMTNVHEERTGERLIDNKVNIIFPVKR